MFGHMSELWINKFREHFDGILEWSESIDDRDRMGADHTEDFHFPPDLVAFPNSTAQVQSLLKWAFENEVPVTPAGAMTGLSGGALPVKGGISCSTKRLNRILKIDDLNHQVIVQPGVIVQEMQEAVEAKGLFYAVDPASRGSCTIGGNLAENSGGPRAVKYGVTKDWVLNLEVVLMDGSVIHTGANTLKNSTGYNLTALFIGSEGTLGMITQATLKLLPWPKYNALMLVPFGTAQDACRAVAEIFIAGAQPSAIEFMERSAIALAMDHLGQDASTISPEVGAQLLIEVDAFEPEALMPQLERIYPVIARCGGGEPMIADDEASKNNLWKLRRVIGEAVKSSCPYKEEDTVVPRGRLPELLDAVKALGREYGFESVCYGHAGDGNLHVNILKRGLSDAAWNEQLPKAIRSLFEIVIEMGGTISGEHGIGWVQKPYMDLAFSTKALQIQQQIKKSLDPKGLLNPSKIWPVEDSKI
ncbi:MAG: FAD-binding oxidoreductase [Flavobacteriales bacterium]